MAEGSEFAPCVQGFIGRLGFQIFGSLWTVRDFLWSNLSLCLETKILPLLNT